MFAGNRRVVRAGTLAVAALAGTLLAMPLVWAVPGPPTSVATASTAGVPAEKHATETQISAARTQHAALQGQVRHLEAHTADQQRQLQQRDATIAALRARLRAAGVPAASGSAGL